MNLNKNRSLCCRVVGFFSSLSFICTSVQFASLAQDESQTTKSSPNNQINSVNVKGNKPTVLFGRIEQIAGSAGAQFPSLKEQTAKLDTRKVSKPVQKGQATTYSGSVVRSFPQNFSGTWGGRLRIWTAQMDPICWQLDADEANRTRQLMVPGKEGSVNFEFSQSSVGKIELEPAQVVFMVPMRDTNMGQELNSMLGAGGLGQAGGLTLPGMDSRQMASVLQQMGNTMNVPIMVSFGSINDPNVKGVSGNDIRAVVLSNTIRQLSPGVLEQQIITQESQRNKKTGRTRQEFAETVVRFTSQNANTLYVQAAAVNYTSDRRFERKMILYGTVRRGIVMQEARNPLGGMTNMMPGMPQMPAGQNPFQNLLPRQ
jgi:hypothetical protein